MYINTLYFVFYYLLLILEQMETQNYIVFFSFTTLDVHQIMTTTSKNLRKRCERKKKWKVKLVEKRENVYLRYPPLEGVTASAW